ncbi:MAG: 3'-5' exonuclease [Clostridia bacterium]|nr:3'-5' exonuclease [Clostridia bacterium]
MKINNTLFVLDTETGGVDPNNDSLMQIAGVVLKGSKVVCKYQALVKSYEHEYVCNDFARSLHKITNEEIEAKGKYPHEIAADLKAIRDKFFDGNPMTIVAHNAAFDISFTKKMFKDCGHGSASLLNSDTMSYDKIFARNAIDTATMALILRLQNKLPFDRCSLDNILSFYNLEMKKEDRHTALGDAIQTAKAFLLMFRSLSGEKTISNPNKKQKEYDTDFDDAKKLNKLNNKDFNL